MTVERTLADFYDRLGVPDSCVLGKRIYKKQFYDTGQLNAADKKAFIEDVEGIEWRYTLKPSTINIPKFEDENHEYLEVAIIQVLLKSTKRAGRITAAIQKAIPYPLVIVVVCDQHLAINVAEKRINRADSNRIVVEESHDSGWINLHNQLAYQSGFLDDFQATNCSYRNFFDFYQDIVSRIVALNCAEATGNYSLNGEGNRSTTERAALLREMHKLQQAKGEIRNRLKGEKNLGKQVALNSEIKSLSDQIEAMKQEL